MQLPLLAPGPPQHPRTDNAPRNTRLQGPRAGAPGEASFSDVMGEAMATADTDTSRQTASLPEGTGQKDTYGKADDGGTASPGIQDSVGGQGAPLLVPAMLVASAVGQVPAAVPATEAGGAAGGSTAAVAAVTATAVPAATLSGQAGAPVGPAAAIGAGLLPAPLESGAAVGKVGAGQAAAAAGTQGPAPTDGTSQAATANTPAANTLSGNIPAINAGAGAAIPPGTAPAAATVGAAQQPGATNQVPAVAGDAERADVPEIRPAAPDRPTSGQQAAAPFPSLDTGQVHTGQPAPLQTPLQIQPPTPPSIPVHAFAAQQAAGANATGFTNPGRLTPQLAGPLFTLATAAPGEHVMTLKVSPENLGPLTVRAHIDAAGVHIELFAPGDAGRDALRTILPELRRGLAESGLGAQLNLSQHGAPQDQNPGAGNQATGQHGEAGQHGELRQQRQPEPTAAAAPDAARTGPRPAVVLSAGRAGALDVLA